MATRENRADLLFTQIKDPATTTADTNTTSVDMQGYETLTMLVSVGESGDTLSGSVKWDLELEESDDNSTFTDVDDADMIGDTASGSGGQFAVIDAAAEDDAVYTVAYTGAKRYVRVVLNATGTHTNGTPIGVIAVRGGGRHKPETNT